MSIPHTHRRRLYERGFLVIPGGVSGYLLRRAKRAINQDLGTQGMPPDELRSFQVRTFCPQLKHAPEILDLYNASGLKGLVESLVGPEAIHPVDEAQIALRFPQNEPDKPVQGIRGGHLDGIYYPGNGVPPGALHSFTALAVVLLSDVPEPFSGNFTVWPQSHAALQNYFRRGDNAQRLGHDGIPKLEYGPPEQITARAGDVVLTNYLLLHTNAPNLASEVRYAVIFRLRRLDHDQHRWDALGDPWLAWDGMQDLRQEDPTAERT